MSLVKMPALPLAAALAAAVFVAGCGAKQPLPAPQSTQALAFSESGENVFDLQAADGGKLDVTIEQATDATRTIMATTQDISYFKGQLTMGSNKVPILLNATQHHASFVNLPAGTWTIELTAYDRNNKPLSKPLDDAEKYVIITPYVVTYANLHLKLYDNYLNTGSGTLQTNIVTKSGDLSRQEVEPLWTSGDLPKMDEYDWAYFDKRYITGLYSAFSVGKGESNYQEKATWEGDTTFGLYYDQGYAYFAAKLHDGYHAPIFKLTAPGYDFHFGQEGPFTPLDALSPEQDTALQAALRHINFSKAPYPEMVYTAQHPYGIRCQRYFYTETRGDGYHETEVMSSFYFSTENYYLIQVDYTDGYVGTAPHDDSYFKVVHIQSMSH